MRKLLLASAVGALTSAAMLASAASPDQSSPEARAYLSYSFGAAAQESASSKLHYGLRMDYSRASADVRPPLMQMDFDRAGLVSTRINGLNAVQRLRLNQDEPPPAEDTSASGGESSSESSGESSSDSSGGGSETTYSIIDWSLIAIGAVGIGFIAAESLDNKDESPDPPVEEPDDGGGLLGGLLGILLTDESGFSGAPDHERQLWLDGGTGQMGDIGG